MIIDLTCPYCEHKQSFEVYPELNVSNEPALKNMVMSFELFKDQCESCTNIIPVSYQTMYHDFDQKLIVVLDPTYNLKAIEINEMLEKDLGDLEGYTVRIVNTPDELKEKILLSDAHLDDRAVELLKQYYAVSALEKNPELEFMAVLFNRGLVEHEIVFITKDQQKFKAEVNTTVPNNLAKIYEKKINELTQPGANMINAQWAGLVLESKH